MVEYAYIQSLSIEPPNDIGATTPAFATPHFASNPGINAGAAHALGLTDSLGASLVLIGLAVHQGFTFTAGRTLVVLVLLLLMNPVISHATLRAALRAGVTPWQRNH